MPNSANNPAKTAAFDTIGRVLLANAEPDTPISDATYSQAAVDAFLRLVFVLGTGPDLAAQHVYDVLHELGFTGQLTFSYSAGDTKTQDGYVFTGPYMRVRTASGELHVLPIGVDQAALDWIDGMAG